MHRIDLGPDQFRPGTSYAQAGMHWRLTMAVERGLLKQRALSIVAQVEPDDIFVVEDNFDALIDDWHHAVSQDEGRFIGGAELATFAAAVVPFLLTFLGDVVKDVVKEQAKKSAGTLLDKLLHRQASTDEAARLRAELEAAIAKSKVAREQKDILRSGFDMLFEKLKPVE